MRDFQEDTPQYIFYKEQHTVQTYEFATRKTATYRDTGRETMTMSQALSLLDTVHFSLINPYISDRKQ